MSGTCQYWKKIKFRPTTRPRWRPENVPTTPEMLKEVEIMREQFDKAPSNLQQDLRKRFVLLEVRNFVLASNRLELVGTQSEGDTEELCNQAANWLPDNTSQKQKETVNTCLALKFSFDNMQAVCSVAKMEWEKLVITPDMIKEIHGVLMQGLLRSAGKFRSSPAQPAGFFDFCYTSPGLIESELLSLTDVLGDILSYFGDKSVPLKKAFNIAAFMMYELLSIHPFVDGNGRLSRIIASRLLSLHHFFPVYMRSFEGSQWRDIYIDALVTCRRDPKHHPCELAALLIESSWQQWCKVCGDLDQLVADDGKLFVGRIYISNFYRVSQGDMNSYIREHYKTLSKHFVEGRKRIVRKSVESQKPLIKGRKGASFKEKDWSNCNLDYRGGILKNPDRKTGLPICLVVETMEETYPYLTLVIDVNAII